MPSINPNVPLVSVQPRNETPRLRGLVLAMVELDYSSAIICQAVEHVDRFGSLATFLPIDDRDFERLESLLSDLSLRSSDCLTGA